MLGAAVTVVLWGGAKWYAGRVREDEQRKQADKFTQEVEKQRAADRAATERILNEAQERQEAAERRAEESRQREAGLVRTIQAIGQQRVAAGVETSRLSDSERRAYIIHQLALRSANDNTPCYTASEEKAIAESIIQYPLCEKQVAAQANQIIEVRNQVAALTDKTAALETKFDALQGYTSRLEGYYTQIYNLIPRKRRGWKCLGLWNCAKAKPLPVPAPIDLHKPSGQL